jgi:hypothetical protein
MKFRDPWDLTTRQSTMVEKHVPAMIPDRTTKILVTKMADSVAVNPTLTVSTVTDVNPVSSHSQRLAAKVGLGLCLMVTYMNSQLIRMA